MIKKHAPWVVTLIALGALVMPWPSAQVNVANNASELSGKTIMLSDGATPRTVTNSFTFDRDPSAPFSVTSGSAKVTNLIADSVDGQDATATSYTPAWTSSGTQPALGNGTLTGSYARIGNVIEFRASLVAGTTTTFGTGTYSISLPLSAGNGAGAINVFVQDASASGAVFIGAAFIASASVCNLYTTEATSAAVGISASAPITFATSDLIHVHGTYFVP